MSEESSNQLHCNHSGSAPMSVLQCPLEPSTFLEALHSSGLHILEEIEKHVTSSQCHHPPLKDLTLHGSLDGSTPLLLACYYGDLGWVKHIVENWDVDLQAAAVYYSDPVRSWGEIRRFGLATPLFVAAEKQQFAIVEYLVGKGVEINGKGTHLYGIEGPTPLQGVLRKSYPKNRASVQDIILLLLESGADPNATSQTYGRHNWTNWCGTDITTALVERGLKLDQRDHLGDTILHNRINRMSFQDPELRHRTMAFIKLLVNNGADLMGRDNEGLTPILLASTKFNWPVLDYMLDRNEILRKEKIDALEMAAATILSVSHSFLELERAFEYLRQALRLRQMEPEPLHKTHLKLKRGRIVGWTTSAQLDQVIAEPAEYHLQSYLIHLRILCDGTREATTTLRHFLTVCVNYLIQQNRLDDIVDVLWATFEKIQLHLLDSHHECGLWRMTDNVVMHLIWVLLQLGKNDPLYNAENFRSILKVLLVTDRAHSGFCSDKCCTNLKSPNHLGILLRIVPFFVRLPEEILNDKKEEELSINNQLSQLVYQGSHSKRGKLLLHMACENLDLDNIRQLLLQFNADPNAGDNDGNGPLHILAAKNHGNREVIESAARILLEYGAHLDRVNQNRKTAADVWKKKNYSQDLPLWLREPGTVPMLQCLSARTIRSKSVPYTKQSPSCTKFLPGILQRFVNMH